MNIVMRNFRLKATSVALLLFTALAGYAQDATPSSSTTSTTTSSTTAGLPADWYMSPWVWLGGGLLLVILLIAIFSGGRTRREVTRTVTTTTEINTD